MAKDKKETEAEQPKKKSKLLLILILLLVLALVGGGGFFAYKKFFAKNKEETKVEKKEQKIEEAKEEQKKKGDKGQEKESLPAIQTKLVQLPTILVNLADPLGRRYLKISIELEVKGTEPEKLIEKKMPIIKDTLILLLSSKTFDDLSTLDKKYKLKMEIAQRLNQILEKPIVTNVFFTEFLVQ